MIFISYSREDAGYAGELVRALKEQQFAIAKDPPLIEGDPFWRSQVKQTFEKCEVMLILWSVAASISPWVDEEVRAFSSMKIFIRLDETLIPQVNNMAAVERQDVEPVLKKLQVPKTDYPTIEHQPEQEIKELRNNRFKEWQHKFLQLNDSKSQIQNLTQISADEWMLSNGLIFKPAVANFKNNSKYTVLLSTIPVTNKQYLQFIEEVNWPAPAVWQAPGFNEADAPVAGLNWFEARAYSKWIGGDLPTEEIWETAAKGGCNGIEFATNDGTLSSANSSFNNVFGEGKPVNPKIYPPNKNGFYGMAGNIWDWCADNSGPHCIIKGGGNMDSENFCKISSCYRNLPIDRDCSVGFRVMMYLKN